MKKGLKSFFSRFLVCFKNRKVSSSPIRLEIEEEEPMLELKAVVCEEDPAAGLNVGEDIKLAGRREEPAAGIEAGEEPAMRIEAGEEPATGIKAGEEESAAGIDVGEGIIVGEDIKVGGWREEPAEGIQELAVGIQAEEEPAAGIETGEEEPTEGIREPAVGIQAVEEPVAGIKVGEKEPAAGIETGAEEPAAGIGAGEEETASRFDAGDEEPAAGIQAGQGEPAARIEAEVETLTAGDEELTAEINAEEELETGIEAGEEEPAAVIEEPLVGTKAKEEPGMGIKAGKEVPAAAAAAIEEPVVGIEAEEETTGIKAGEEEPAAVIGEPVMWIGAEPTMRLKAGKEEPVAGIEEPVPGLKADDAWKVYLAEAPVIKEKEPVAGLKDDGEVDEDDLEEPMIEGFVLEVQLAETEGDSVVAQGASFSRVLEAFLSMNLKLHTLTAQLASLNADLEAHGEVNNYLEDKFPLKLPGGFYDSISPPVESPILELAAVLDAEEASPFVNVDTLEEVNLEEDTMKQETIFEVREACVSADLEVDVQALTAQLGSLSAESELSVIADEMLINLKEELALKPAKTFMVEEDFIFPTVELLASDVSLSSVVGFDIGEDVEEGQGDIEEEDWDAMNCLISDAKEGDLDSEDEEGRGPMNDSTSDVKEGNVDLEDEGRGAMSGWTFDVKGGNVDPGDEEGRGAMNAMTEDEKEGDVNLEDEDRGTLNDSASDVREGDVDSGDGKDQGIMNGWIGVVKWGDIDSEDGEDQGTMNCWTRDVKEGDVDSEDEEDRGVMKDWIGDVNAQDGETRGTINDSICDLKAGDTEDEDDRCTMNDWNGDVKDSAVDSEDEEDEDRGTMIGGVCDVKKGVIDGREVKLNVDIEYGDGPAEQWDEGTHNGRTISYVEEENGDVDADDEAADVYMEDNIDVKAGHHELANGRLKRKVFEVFIGGLHKGATEDDIRNVFNQVGEITGLRLPMNPVTKKNRGFAFLCFATKEQADRAILELKNPIINGRRCGVTSSWGRDAELEDEVMTQVTTIFIDGLPASWDEDRVKNLVLRFGDTEKVKLACNMPAARRLDFGFVTFKTHEAAIACVEGINNDEFAKGDEQVNLRARLSRPFVWGRGKHGPVEFRHSKGALDGRLLWNAPPHIEFGGRGPRGGFRGRGAPIGGRSIGFANRHPLMYEPDGARRLQYSNRVYNRKPQGHICSTTTRPNNYRRGGYEGHQSGGGSGDGRWSSSLYRGFLPYGSDDVGCRSYSSYSGYSREGIYFGGKTRV